MSLDINVKVKPAGKKRFRTVLSNNFYGFKHFSDSNNRHRLAHQMGPEDVVDYATYKDFIERSVDEDRQDMYLDLVDKRDEVKVEIW